MPQPQSISLLSIAVLALSVLPARASILEATLNRIQQMGKSPLLSVMINLAETIATPTSEDRRLRPGDSVILGYDNAGNPVSGIAGKQGVIVSSALAGSMPIGLAAGLYPVESALYALPPAGQLSLYNETGAGQALQTARDLALSRIDGTVTNVINGILLPDLVPATLVAVYDAQGGQDGLLIMQDIRTTVLGAVNAGEIVSQITVSLQPGGTIDLALAGISQGADLAIQEAQSQATAAMSAHVSQIGGGPDVQALALNLAHSASGISGEVMNHVNGKSVGISEIVTTVIGAVNGGRVNGVN
jgi:hypothetical protein